ncbi:IclR family transcriptional regulator [Salipiger pacificus]|nr:IclR family transcriptional regulator [Alloyangia pacifica]MCA0948060.1 IclR family transcriptional regulator [Alloyangia pacifica]
MSSLDDAIAVLGCFTLKESELSQAEITRRLDRPKATMSRVLRTMREGSLLHFDPVTRLYSPGVHLFELGQIFRAKRNFLDLVQKRLQEACEIGGHTGYITAFDGPDLVVMQMIRGSSPVAISATPGFRVPAHSNSNGRAMLAELGDAEWRERVPEPMAQVSAKTPASHAELQPVLDEIRRSGISSSSDELHQGVSSQGIALRDPDTKEVVGVAISYPTVLRTEALREQLIGLLNDMKQHLMRHAGSS